MNERHYKKWTWRTFKSIISRFFVSISFCWAFSSFFPASLPSAEAAPELSPDTGVFPVVSAAEEYHLELPLRCDSGWEYLTAEWNGDVVDRRGSGER
jgi:hypothetical protein